MHTLPLPILFTVSLDGLSERGATHHSLVVVVTLQNYRIEEVFLLTVCAFFVLKGLPRKQVLDKR